MKWYHFRIKLHNYTVVKVPMMQNALTDLLGIEHPIIQAPMASAATPEMVIAASEAGALGSLGAAYMSPDEIRSSIHQIRRATIRPFQVNLFSPPEPRKLSDSDVGRAMEPLRAIRQELDLTEPNEVPQFKDQFLAQLKVLLEENISIIGFHFGLPEPEEVEQVKASGALLIGCATRPSDAVILEQSGADIIVAQGFEAGGHQGTFIAAEEPSTIGLMSLIPQIVDAVSVPVIAAGGLMDGRGLAAALALGAGAGQLGTAFLATQESKAHDLHKKLLLERKGGVPRFTRAFSGRPARGIVNRMMEDIEKTPNAILPFPYQHILTSEIRAVAAKTNKPEFLSMWAGQGANMVRNMSTGEMVRVLAKELEIASGIQRVV